MGYPKEARLLWEVDVGDFGGDELFVTDLNGDGRPELLLRQCAGNGRTESVFKRFGPRGFFTEEERYLDCVAAIDLEGKLLWRVGEPHRGEDPYYCHGSGGFGVARLEGGPLPDALAVRWDTLTVLDGCSGEVKSERKFPADNFNDVVPMSLKGDPSRQQVMVKVGGAAYSPYKLGNPAVVLDSDLSEFMKVVDETNSAWDLKLRKEKTEVMRVMKKAEKASYLPPSHPRSLPNPCRLECSRAARCFALPAPRPRGIERGSPPHLRATYPLAHCY